MMKNNEMDICRCMKELDTKGYVEGMCFNPCDKFTNVLEERKLQEKIDSKKENNNVVDSKDLKLKALEKIKQNHPYTYSERTDYKLIKDNL